MPSFNPISRSPTDTTITLNTKLLSTDAGGTQVRIADVLALLPLAAVGTPGLAEPDGTSITSPGGGTLQTAASGTVTSVGLSIPSTVFQVQNSPVTTSGAFTVLLNAQSPGTFFRGPNSGVAGTPSFGPLVGNDFLNLVDGITVVVNGSGKLAAGGTAGLGSFELPQMFTAAGGSGFTVPTVQPALRKRAPAPGTINSLAWNLAGGNLTINVKIGGNIVTGLSGVVASGSSSAAATAANTYNAGDFIDIEITAVSALTTGWLGLVGI